MVFYLMGSRSERRCSAALESTYISKLALTVDVGSRLPSLCFPFPPSRPPCPDQIKLACIRLPYRVDVLDPGQKYVRCIYLRALAPLASES